jgi:CRISPR-associated protein Cas4
MISVTSLSSYDYCKRKLFLEKVLKIVVVPKTAIVKGTIRHETYDAINKKEEELVKSIKQRFSLNRLVKVYQRTHAQLLKEVILGNKSLLQEADLPLAETFRNTLPYILAESQSRAVNIHKFIKKHNVLGDELWNRLEPKLESEFKLRSRNLKLSGIIDQIEVFKDHVVPVELKTGKAPRTGVWPGHKLQIGAYMLMLQDQGHKVNEGFVNYLDHNAKRPVTLTPFLKQEIFSIRDNVLELFERKELPDFCTNENKCGVCSLKELCYNREFIADKIRELENNLNS